MTFLRYLLGAPGLLLLACGEPHGGAASVAQSAIDGVTFTASPTTGLPFVGPVEVQATGVPAMSVVTLAQCPAGAIHIETDCPNRTTIFTGEIITVALTFSVRRELTAQNGQVVDCAAGGCTLALALEGRPTELYTIPLAFAPAVPRLSVTPDTDLVDLQPVLVRVNDLDVPTARGVVFGQCRATSTLVPVNTLVPPGCVLLARDIYYPELRGAGATMLIQRRFTPEGEAGVVCDAPGKCVVFAIPEFTHTAAMAVPITFRPVTQPPRGSLTFAPATPQAYEDLEVRGSGWTPYATVSVQICGADLAPQWCVGGHPVEVAADGTFSTSVRAAPGVEAPYRFDDCHVAGRCYVTSYDTFDRATTLVTAGITVAPTGTPRGTLDATLPPLLISGVPVRLVGRSWAPSHGLRLLQCKGTELTECQMLTTYIGPDAGNFRQYASPVGKLLPPVDFDCTLAPGSCSLVVFDPESATTTQIRVPLTFSNAQEFPITSHYEPQWENMLQQATAATGIAAPELQKTGVFFTGWVLRSGGARSGTKLPTTGSVSHTTVYNVDEYRRSSQLAAEFDYTLEEMQKIGAVFWAWYMLGMPPLP